MKKLSWIIALCAIFAMAFVSFIGCDPGSSGEMVTIQFRAGEGYFPVNDLSFRNVEINKGGTVTPPDAVLDGYEIDEWNTAADGSGTVLTSSTRHDEDTIYYAIWFDNTFEVTQTWVVGTDSGVSADPILVETNVQKWEITDPILAAIREAETGSMLRLHFDATDGRTADDAVEGSERSGWSIGSIGVATTADNADVIGLWAPQNAGLIYHVNVELEWVLGIIGNGNVLMVFTPTSNGDILTKIELLEPINTRNPPARPTAHVLPETRGQVGDEGFIAALNISFGYFGDPRYGKGDILGDDLELIKSTIAGLTGIKQAVLRVYMRDMSPNEERNIAHWGVGQINEIPCLNGSNRSQGENNYRATNISGAQLNTILAANATRLVLNPYNDHAIILVELWALEPPNTVVTFKNFDGATTGTAVALLSSRNVDLTAAQDGSSYEFVGTGGGHRGKFVSFELDFGTGNKLSNYQYVSFDLQVLGGPANRRLALLAQSTAYANASLPNHQTTNDSSNGFLAGYQVTIPMSASVNPVEAPLNIKLEMAPVFANTLDAHSKLFLCIYEHTDAAANIRISNIVFTEYISGCHICAPEECVCDAAITAALNLIEETAFNADRLDALSSTSAQTKTQSLVNALTLNGVIAVVVPVPGGFTAATNSTAGTFTFTVKLNRGDGEEQITDPITLTIAAHNIQPVVVWSLASYLARTDITFANYTSSHATLNTYSGLTRITNNSAFAPLRANSGTDTNQLIVVDRTNPASPFIIAHHIAATQHINIDIGTQAGGLGLKTAELEYEVRITGTVVSTGNSTTATVGFAYNGATQVSGTQIRPNGTYSAGQSFNTEFTLPQTTANPATANIRISPTTPNTAIRIDSIEIELIGVRD